MTQTLVERQTVERMDRTIIILGLSAIFVSFNIESNDAVTFKLTNFECKSYNNSWVVVHTCRLKVMQRNRIGAYFNATVVHPANDIFVHGQVYKKANGYKPWVLSTRVDACRFVKNQNSNPIAKVVGALFLDFTNLNHTCPYNGTQLVTGAYLRPELLMLPIPTGDYKLYMGWYFDKKLQVETNASATFVENLLDQ